MTNSNFLKKLLATASVVAVSAGASNAFAALKQANGAATIANGAGSVNIVDTATPPVGVNFNNGDSLTYLGNHTLNTAGNVTVHTIDLNNKTAGVFTVSNDVSLSSVINTGGNQKLSTTVANNKTLTLDNNAGLNASGSAASGGIFTHLGPLTLGGGAGRAIA